MSKKVRIWTIAAVLVFAALASGYDNELIVKLTERIDVTAETDGVFTWNFTATGDFILEVSNENSTTGTGTSDTRIFDIWIPIDDPNSMAVGGTLALNSSSTTDPLIIADPCMIQICALLGSPPSAFFCVCADGTSTSLDLTNTPALDYNPNTNGTDTYTYIIHINSLQGDSKVIITADLSGTLLTLGDAFPMLLEESFRPNKLVNKACLPIEVELNVTSNLSSSACGDANVTVKKELSSSGDWSDLNATAAGQGGNISTDEKRIEWEFTLSGGATETLTFNVTACANITGNSSKSEMGRAYVKYELLNDSCMHMTYTNITIGHVTAVGPASINVSKSLLPGSNPLNWTEDSAFYDSTIDLNYTLYRFRLWAGNGTNASSLDPNDAELSGSEYNCSSLPDNVSAGDKWYCDGNTFLASDIPVVFGRPYFELIEGGISGWEDYYQFRNSKNTSFPLNSDYYIIENLWIINGYFVSAEKEVLPTPGYPGCYNISITVENLGAECTPYLYLYDIVPEDFYNMSGSGIISPERPPAGPGTHTSPYDIMVSSAGSFATIAKPGNAQPLTPLGYRNLENASLLAFSVPIATEDWTGGSGYSANGTFDDSQYTGKTEGLTGEFAGTGYRWELFPLRGAGGAADDECSASKYTNLEIAASTQAVITYTICADDENMTYYPSQLYIVGVDPIQSDAPTSPQASMSFGIGRPSSEPILIIILVLVTIAAIIVMRRMR